MREFSSHTPKVSVVIPMYNCEEFVHGVLRMFSDQTFDDFEVICVIDGATDGTEEEVKKYCETDDRFRYVIRENGGAGAARNTGLDMAKGKYIVFSDADDCYHRDYLLRLYEAAEKNRAEIAVCGAETYDYIAGEFRKVNKGFNKSFLSEGKVFSGKKTKRILNNIDIQIANKMILMDFLKRNNLKFSETKASNDLFFAKATLACADRIVVVNDDLLIIRRFINPNSISSNRSNYSHIALNELQKLYQWMEERDMLKYYISDYFSMFDITVNYEMKNGVNPIFIKELARIINCESVWKKMNGGQIMQVLERSFGDKGAEIIASSIDDANDEEKKKIEARNEKIRIRNKNRNIVQELVRKESLDIFNRDLDDPKSESADQIAFIKDLYSDCDKADKSSDSMGNPKITVVIPMFNCADYVENVLSMFVRQSFTDFEVICVVDGATDSTEKKVSDFCKKDQRFTYVFQENKGPGAARNTGLNLAKGKYTIFSDADDEYSSEYLKKMYETAKRHDAQMTICLFLQKNHLTKTDDVKGFDYKKLCGNIPYCHFGVDDLFLTFGSRVTNVLFSTEFLKENGIFFPNVRVSEDGFFLHTALSVADRILVLNEVLINYHIYGNNDSITSKMGRYQHEAVFVLRLLYQWLKDHSLLDIHLEDYYKRANDVLIKYGGFAGNPKFISEFTHMLNAEEPWKKMSSNEILDHLNSGLTANNAARKLHDLSQLDSIIVESDEELKFLLSRLKNITHTAELLCRVSLCKYGRDFYNPERPFHSDKENKYDQNNKNNLKISDEMKNKILRNENQSEYIHIVFVCDDGYAIPTATAITSLICSKKKETKYSITIIAVDMNDENITTLHALKHKNVMIRVVEFQADQVSCLSNTSFTDFGVTTSALVKFNIPQIVSSTDRAIYLDGDVLVQKDLSELYFENIDDYYAGVIRDMPQTLFSKQLFGIPYGEDYFNSGVMLLNIKKLNEDNITEKLIKTKMTLETNLMDQDVFNEIFKDKLKQLPIEYNTLYVSLVNSVRKYSIDQINSLYDKSYESIDEIREDSSVIHFCSRHKPWKYYDAPMADKWLEYFYKSPFGERIIVRKSVRNKLSIEQNGLFDIRDSYNENIIPIVFIFSGHNADEMIANIDFLLNDQEKEKIKYTFFIMYNNNFYAPDALIKIRDTYKEVQLINASNMIKNDGYYFKDNIIDYNYMKLLVPEILTEYKKIVILDDIVKKSFSTCFDRFENSYDYGYVAVREGITKSRMIIINCKNFISNSIKHKYIKACNEKVDIRTFDYNNSMCFLEFN